MVRFFASGLTDCVGYADNAGQGKIRPDLVADHHHIVLSEQLHCLLQLPALPDSAAGIVRRADDGGVNLMLHDLFFHVDIVHAPDTGAVLFERAVDDVIAVVFQAAGKADVGRAQNEDLVAREQKTFSADTTPPSTPFS